MGTLSKPTYTIPLPAGATVRGDQVVWTARGQAKTGKLSGDNRVLCVSDVWVAQYVDETGKVRRVSTKCKNEAAARRVLIRLEDEVTKIHAGILKRTDLTVAAAARAPIDEHLDGWRVSILAGNAGSNHADNHKRLAKVVLDECGITLLKDLDRDRIEHWIAEKRERGKISPRTINSHIVALKQFTTWCTETDRLTVHPLRKIKKLNEAVDTRKRRRSFTEEELKRIGDAARARKYRRKNKAEEHVLIYRLLAGTGLRSNELAQMTPANFDFDRCRFTLRADKTKNKKETVLPLRSDLAALLKGWINDSKIKPTERIFNYSVSSLYQSFKRDLAAAGIDRIGADGRSVDVHALRRTFGTMLARAGVPLTTTQRLMRHSTPELTAKLYIDVEPIDMTQAVEKLTAH